MKGEIDVQYEDGSWHLWSYDKPPTKEEEEARKKREERWLRIESIIGMPILPRTRESIEQKMKMISLTDEEKREIFRRWNIVESDEERNRRKRSAQIKRDLLSVVLILAIIGFIIAIIAK